MRKRETNVFNIAFLDLLSGALGAVIILYVAVPKSTFEQKVDEIIPPSAKQKSNDVAVKGQEKIDQKAINEKITEIEELKESMSSIKDELAKVKAENTKLVKDNQALYKVIDKKTPKPKKERKPASISPVDVGFKFNGKRIVFIIDVSGSMYKEDKIGQVKAGLKMLITSMGSEYKIDVVQYPDGVKKTHKPLWHMIKKTSKDNKREIYKFLHQLRPYGATPTRDVIKFAINHYHDATDIVLLSDGAPTKGKTRDFEDIYSVLRDIRMTNQGRRRPVQINTIGVGSDFVEGTNNDAYIFLQKLAKEHKGFFYGF